MAFRPSVTLNLLAAGAVVLGIFLSTVGGIMGDDDGPSDQACFDIDAEVDRLNDRAMRQLNIAESYLKPGNTFDAAKADEYVDEAKGLHTTASSLGDQAADDGCYDQ